MSGVDVLEVVGALDGADVSTAGSAECAELLRASKQVRPDIAEQARARRGRRRNSSVMHAPANPILDPRTEP